MCTSCPSCLNMACVFEGSFNQTTKSGLVSRGSLVLVCGSFCQPQCPSTNLLPLVPPRLHSSTFLSSFLPPSRCHSLTWRCIIGETTCSLFITGKGREVEKDRDALSLSLSFGLVDPTLSSPKHRHTDTERPRRAKPQRGKGLSSTGTVKLDLSAARFQFLDEKASETGFPRTFKDEG